MLSTETRPASAQQGDPDAWRRERSAPVKDPKRLEELARSKLLDTPPEVEFDRITTLAAKLVNAPISLVSLVDSHRQFFKSCSGLPEPWATRRETPLSHSFCQFVTCGEALIIEDARTHPLTVGNLAVTELDVVAYLGFPLVTLAGQVLGSFCVIDNKAREWTELDLEVTEGLARAVIAEIRMRFALHEVEERAREAREAAAKIRELESELELLRGQTS